MYVCHTTILDLEGTDPRSVQIEELVPTLPQRREYGLMRRTPCRQHAVHDGVLTLPSIVDDVDLSLSVTGRPVHDERAETSADVEHDAGQLARRRLLARRHVTDEFSAISGGSIP